MQSSKLAGSHTIPERVILVYNEILPEIVNYPARNEKNFGSLISFFRSFILALGGEFSFPR